MSEIKLTAIVMVGTMTPMENRFHNVCTLPALQEGRVLRLEDSGVTDIGQVVGCDHCNVWLWTDQFGVTRQVGLRDDKEN
jgi:hypothetical protein